jgi:IS30 family transposase
MRMKRYKRLSLLEREEISRKLILGLSLRQIGRDLSRSASTISRELGVFTKSTYRAHLSQKRSIKRSSSRKYGKRKLIFNKRLLEVVKEKLNEYWSPRQVASYLKLHYKSKSMQVSAETIYSYIYIFLRRSLREEFTNQLRRGHKKRRVRGRSAKGQKSDLKDMVSIDERPAEVDDRLVPGHWEGDIMIGGAREQTALGTLVERKTRFAILVPLKSKKAEDVRKAFAKEINKLPKELRLSLTYDQGREMAQHKKLTEATEMKVYFAHPKSPWERGTNENTNGLLRQYFPKATNFKNLTRLEIKKVQRSLNTRPRETLGWKTPHETMRELLR